MFERLCRDHLKGSPARREPKAVCFLPVPKTEEDRRWHDTLDPTYRHFHARRRSRTFDRTDPNVMRKTFKLAQRHHSVVRWGMLGTAFTVLVGALLVAFLARNIVIEWAATRAGEAAFGGPTQIMQVDSNFNPSVDLQQVQVAKAPGAMRNRFEADRVTGKLLVAPLLSGRVHLENLRVDGLRFDTQRNEPAPLDEEKADVDGRGVEEDAEELEPVTRVEDFLEALEQMLEPPAPEEFETVQLARRLEDELQARKARLEAIADPQAAQAWQQKVQGVTASLQEMKRKAPQLPPSYDKLRYAAQAFQQQLGGTALDQAEEHVEALRGMELEAEARTLAQVDEEIKEARQNVDKSRAVLKQAEDIEKVRLTDVGKARKLIADLGDAVNGLRQSVGTLDQTREDAALASQSVRQKVSQGREHVAGAQQSLQEASAKLQQGASSAAGLAEMQEQAPQVLQDIQTLRANWQQEHAGALEEAERLRKQLADARQQIEQTKALVAGVGQDVRQAVAADRQMLQERYAPANMDVTPLIAALVGERLAAWSGPIWRLWQYLQPRLFGGEGAETAETATGEPAVGYGRTYAFPPSAATQDAPAARLWIKHAGLSAEFPSGNGTLGLEVAVDDISSNLRLTGRDVVGTLKSTQEDRKVAGEFRITPAGGASLQLEATGVSLEGTSLSGRYGPQGIESGRMNATMQVRLGDGDLELDGSIALDGVSLQPPAQRPGDPRLAGILEGIYGDVPDLALRFGAARRDGRLDMQVKEVQGLDDVQRLVRDALEPHQQAAKKEAEALLNEHVPALEQRVQQLAGLGRTATQAQEAVESRAGTLEAVSELRESTLGRFDQAEKTVRGLSDPEAAVAQQRRRLQDLQQSLATARGQWQDRAGGVQDQAKTAEEAIEKADAELKQMQEKLKQEVQRLVKLVSNPSVF
jgi:hypothetical protein